MDAAERLFLEHGVGATTIEQITTAAAVAKGTFYLYFRAKEDVRSALSDRFAQSHLAHVQAAEAETADGDWAAKLKAWAHASADFYLASVELHDVLFYEGRAPTREGLVENLVIDRLTTLLEAGADAGAWTLQDARFTAVFLFSGLHGVVDHAMTREAPVDRNRLARRVDQIVLRAVGLEDA